MLDYDALRSKVRKLTEKPDKDPSKLPRTEKETEMVGSSSLAFPSVLLSASASATATAAASSSTSPRHELDNSHRRERRLSSLFGAPSGSGAGSRPDCKSGASGEEAHSTSDPDLFPDLTIPSPSKILQRPEIEKVRRLGGMSLSRSPSLPSGNTSGASSRLREGLESLGRALGAAPDEVVLSTLPRGPGARRSFSLRSGFEESTLPHDGDAAAGYCDEGDDGGEIEWNTIATMLKSTALTTAGIYASRLPT